MAASDSAVYGFSHPFLRGETAMNNSEQSELPPEPEESGVEELQQTSDKEDEPGTAVAVSEGSGIAQVPLTDAVQDYMDSGIRGQAAMAFLYVHIQQLERSLKETRDELDEVRGELKDSRSSLATERQTTAVLRERLRGVQDASTLRNVMLTLGGLLGGAGLPQLALGITGWAIGALALGGLLLLGGWILPFRRTEEGGT